VTQNTDVALLRWLAVVQCWEVFARKNDISGHLYKEKFKLWILCSVVTHTTPLIAEFQTAHFSYLSKHFCYLLTNKEILLRSCSKKTSN